MPTGKKKSECRQELQSSSEQEVSDLGQEVSELGQEVSELRQEVLGGKPKHIYIYIYIAVVLA